MINVITGAVGTVTGTPNNRIDKTIGPTFSELALNDVVSLPFPTGTILKTTPITGAYICFSGGTGNGTWGAMGNNTGGGFSFGWTNSTTPAFGFYGPAGTTDIGTVARVINTPYFFACSSKDNVTDQVVVNLATGQVFVSTAAGRTLDTNNTTGTFLMGKLVTAGSGNGIAAAMFTTGDRLSITQLLQWAENPWSFWYPEDGDPFNIDDFVAPASFGSGISFPNPPSNPNLLAFPSGSAPGFDPSHIAAGGIVRASGIANGANFFNPVDGTKGTPTALGIGSILLGSIGPAVTNSTAGKNVKMTTSVTPLDAALTLAAIAQFTTVGVVAQNMVQTDSNGAGWVLRAQNIGFTFLGVGGSSLVSTLVPSINVPYFVVGSGWSGGAALVIVNLQTGAVYSYTSSAAFSSSGSTGQVLFAGDAANKPLNGAQACGMYSNKFNSLQTLLRWAVDPWAFWYPRNHLDDCLVSYGNRLTSTISGGIIINAYSLAVDAGIFSMTGEAAALAAARQLVANTGYYSLTGEPITEAAARKLALNCGFFAMTGEAIGLKASRALALNTGLFAMTGEPVTVIAARKLGLATGFYQFTGEAETLARGRNLSMNTGFFSFAGESVVVMVSRGMPLPTGYFGVNGIPVTLSRTGTGTLIISAPALSAYDRTVLLNAVKASIGLKGEVN